MYTHKYVELNFAGKSSIDVGFVSLLVVYKSFND